MRQIHSPRMIGAFALVVLCVLLAGCKPFAFTLVFKEGKNIRPGQKVIYHGVQIGRVTSVDIDDEQRVRVGVRIERRHRKLAYQEARFTIKSATGPILPGEMQIEMEDHGAKRTPIRAGMELRGYEGFWKELSDNVGKTTSGAAELIKGAAEVVKGVAAPNK